VTVTLNPTVDKSTSVSKVMPEHKLRCSQPHSDPGGGGVNVARVVHELGGDATAIWTRGGHVGALLDSLLEKEGIAHRPIAIEDVTREHLIVYEDASEQQYRFGMPGPRLSREEVDAVIETVTKHNASPDYLVLSGSLPGGVEDDIYARIARDMPDDCRVILDTRSDVLARSLETPVFLIKPNVRELGQLAGREINSDEEIIGFSQDLIEKHSVQVVVTSLGSGGAILVMADDAEQLRSPTVKIRSKVGAGDSMVGGMVTGLSKGWSVRDAVRFGIAAGSAAVTTEGTRLCRREDVERLYEQMGSGE
jgi:6-phosphofructokinase 2